MATFDELVASRRKWIEEVLKPWCAAAARADLMKAHVEWADIAGKVDPDATLWTWAWGRFPALVHEGMAGVNETREVRVIFRDRTEVSGFPDARQSRLGRLVLLARSSETGRHDIESGPHSIDDVASVELVRWPASGTDVR